MRNLPVWASLVLAVVGAVMVASMFFPWIDFGFGVESTTTGLSVAWHVDHWLFLVPGVGAWLAIAAATRAHHTRVAAFAAGATVVGDVAYEFGKDMIHMPLGGWLVFGGAATVLLGVPTARRALRTLGGAAMVVGYALSGGVQTASLSISGALIAVEGIVAVFAGFSAHRHARWVALAAGGLVYALLFAVCGLAASIVFGVGAWSAFGASVVALAIALAAPDAGAKTH